MELRRNCHRRRSVLTIWIGQSVQIAAISDAPNKESDSPKKMHFPRIGFRGGKGGFGLFIDGTGGLR